MSRYTVKNGCIMKNMFYLWSPPIVVKSQSEADALCTSVVYILDSENEDLAKSVQILNDSNTKLQAENDAIRKALLTCSVKRQELQEKLRVSEPYVMSAMSDQATINTLGEQITELQAENKALRETILGEVTTADDFNSEFRHNPDDDAPSAVTWYTRALNTEANDVDTATIESANQFTPISGTYRMTAYDPDDDTTAYDTTKCDSCQKEIPFDDTNFVQNSDGTVRYECNVCYNLDAT